MHRRIWRIARLPVTALAVLAMAIFSTGPATAQTSNNPYLGWWEGRVSASEASKKLGCEGYWVSFELDKEEGPRNVNISVTLNENPTSVGNNGMQIPEGFIFHEVFSSSLQLVHRPNLMRPMRTQVVPMTGRYVMAYSPQLLQTRNATWDGERTSMEGTLILRVSHIGGGPGVWTQFMYAIYNSGKTKECVGFGMLNKVRDQTAATSGLVTSGGNR